MGLSRQTCFEESGGTNISDKKGKDGRLKTHWTLCYWLYVHSHNVCVCVCDLIFSTHVCSVFHFIRAGIKNQGNWVTCSGSHGWSVWNWNLNLVLTSESPFYPFVKENLLPIWKQIWNLNSSLMLCYVQIVIFNT